MSRHSILIPISASFVLGILLATAPAQHRVPNGAKVLLLSGGQRDHHAYRRQSQLLQKALEDTGQLQVTICEEAAVLETPIIRKYAAIVAMADRRDPEFRLTPAQQRALLQLVHDEGKGFFSLHGFCCADRSWDPEMRELLGGVLAHFGTPDTKVRVGRYPVRITDRNHPITRGASDFEHDDELYYHLQTRGELKPLAVAVFEDKEWPILWTRSYGSGRVCVSVFGHCGVQPDARDPLEHAPFRSLIVRGIAWTAGRELKQP
jgi:uncharacterized protein